MNLDSDEARLQPRNNKRCERCGSTSEVERVKYEKDGFYFSGWWCRECKSTRLRRGGRPSRRRKLPSLFSKRSAALRTDSGASARRVSPETGR